MSYEDLDLNVKATLRLLEVCRQHNRKAKILFSSSRMVLGKIKGDKIAEDAPTNPLSMYGIHKLTSEKYLLMYYKEFGIPSIVLRITNPYGPRQQIKHNKYSLVGWFVRQAIEGKVIKIFGDGKQLRDYVYVDDIVEAFVRCGIEPKAVGEVINVGSGIGTEFQYMVHKVVDIVKNGRIEYVPWPNDYERIETGDVRVDVSKLHDFTSWRPTHTLTEGIEKTYKYYNIHSDRYV
jgi:nucleoside-diphosphate-sugar epimerase